MYQEKLEEMERRQAPKQSERALHMPHAVPAGRRSFVDTSSMMANTSADASYTAAVKALVAVCNAGEAALKARLDRKEPVNTPGPAAASVRSAAALAAITLAPPHEGINHRLAWIPV